MGNINLSDLQKTASDIFGISSLYAYQNDILNELLRGNNTLGIVPTGGGKSLIFQLFGYVSEGIAIIVSPLKALMQEQADYLNKHNINSIIISSDLGFQDQRKTLINLEKINPKFIYVSPERLTNSFFRYVLKQLKQKISLLVIDEAHCISQWGNDFRPAYNKIIGFIEYLGFINKKTTILALTATLAAKQRDDMKMAYGIVSEIIEKPIVRSNLMLNFIKVDNDAEKIINIKTFIDNHKLRKVIIYSYSKKKCEDLTKEFINSAFFHADMTIEEKKKVYDDFNSGKINVMLATTAFGMGMNIDDVDGVIHYQIPPSVEEYYQHVGRGARKSNICPVCHCLFLWSEKNFKIKREDIERDVLKEDEFETVFCDLNEKQQPIYICEISETEIMTNDGKWGSNNIQLVLYYFEKFNISRQIGEVNGKPKTLDSKFISNDIKEKSWTDFISKLGFRNRYTAFIKDSNELIDLINYIHSEEYNGHLIKLPATEKIIFIEFLKGSIKDDIIKMINLSDNIKAYKLKQLNLLKELCISDDKTLFILDVLSDKK